jgi:Flp pilus assembly protein TadD
MEISRARAPLENLCPFPKRLGGFTKPLRRILIVIILGFVLNGAALAQDTESSIPGIVLGQEGVGAVQSFILEGPSFDPNNDGLAPATELRTSGSSAGKRLQSFILPWTPCVVGTSLNSAKALATGKESSLYGSYQNGVEFALGPESGLDLQSAFFTRKFFLRTGALWISSHRGTTKVDTSRSEIVCSEGGTFLVRTGVAGDQIWVLSGDVEFSGQCTQSTLPIPWEPVRTALKTLRQGDFQSAAQEMQSAPSALDLRAALEDVLGRQVEALGLYQEILSREPDNTHALFRLATLEARTGRLEEAVETLSRVTGRDRVLAVALQGYLLAQAGRRNEARQLLEEALDSSAELPLLQQRMLLVVKALSVERKEAIDLLREVHSSFPNDPFLANDLGVYLASAGRFKEGLKLLQMAKKRAPVNPIIRLNIGTIYLLAGQSNRAQNEFALLSLFAPGSGIARQNLALAYDKLGYRATGNRLLAQSTALDPLLIAPGRGEIVFNGTYREDQDPNYFTNMTRRVGDLAISLTAESGQELITTREASSVQLGLPMGKSGNLVGFVASRSAQLEGGLNREDPVGILLYQNKLGKKTRVWAAASYQGPLLESDLPTGLSRVKESNYRFEARMDRRLSPRQGASFGVSHLRGRSLVQGAGSELTDERTIERAWAQSRQIIGSKTILTTGLGVDRLRGADARIDPYLGLIHIPDEKTTLSLGVLRQSDIPLLSDPAIRTETQLLDDPLISITSRFPLTNQELDFMRFNSPDLLPLPFWDYRLQLRRSVTDDIYAVLELHQTDVLPSDIAGQVSDPLLAARPSTGRSRLRGAGIQGEFQRKRIFANLSYKYRDYRDEQGNRWLLVPRHEVQGQVLVPLGQGYSLGIVPVYQSDLVTPFGDTDVGSLSAFIRIPIDRGSLNLGYLNLVSTDRRIAEGSVLVNLILKF